MAEVKRKKPVEAEGASQTTRSSGARTAGAKPTRKRGTVNKEVIMNVASSLFNRQGYDRTSLDHIASDLSITKPSLYYHFSSKEAILLECIKHGYVWFRQQIAERDDPRLPGSDRVRLFLELYVELLQDEMLSTIVADERVMSEDGKTKYRNYKRSLNRELEERLQAGIDDGSIAKHDPKVVSYAIFGMINWTTHWREAANLMGHRQIASDLWNLVFNGLSKRPE